MEKTYVCIASGQKKDTGAPYARFANLVKTKNSEFLNLQDSFSEPKEYPILTKITLKS